MNSWKRNNSKKNVAKPNVTSQANAFRQTFLLDENGTGVGFIQHTLANERKKSEDLTTQLARAVEAKNAAVDTVNRKLHTAISGKKSAIEEKDAAIKDLEKTMSQLRSATEDKDAAIETAEKTTCDKDAKIKSIIDNHETAIKEKNDVIISMTTKANQKVASLEAAAKESKELSAERLKMESLEKQNAQRCNESLRQEIEELKENTKQLEERITTSSKELQKVVLEKKEASVGLNNAQRSNESLRQEIEEREENTKQLEERITTNSKKLEQVTSEKKKVSVDLKNALVSNKALRRESEELEENTKQLEERITTSSKELQKVVLEKKEASVGLENAQRSNESFQREIEELTEQLEQTITASSKKLQQVVLEKKAASVGLENAQRSNESLQKEIKELRNDKELQLIVIADLKKIQAQDKVKLDALSVRLYNETEEHRKTAMNFANVYGQNEIAKKERNDLSAKVNLIESKNEKLLNNLTEISSQKDVIEQAQTNLEREYDGMKSLLECTQIANQDLKSEISKLEGQAAQLKDEIKKEAEGKNKAENSVRKYTVAYDTLLQQHEDCKQQLVDLTEANDKLSKQVLEKMTIKEYIEKHGNFPSSSHNTTGTFCPDDDPVGPFLSDNIGNGTFGDNDILKRQQECVQCINDQKCASDSKEKAKKTGHCITCKKGRYFDKDALTCCGGKYTRHQEMMKLGYEKNSTKGKKKRGASASAETASENKKKQKKGLKTSGLSVEEEKVKNNDENNTVNGRKSSPRLKFHIPLPSTSNKKRRSFPKLPLGNNKTSKHPAVVLCCAGELCPHILGKTITGRSHPCLICKGRMHGNICSDGTVEDPNCMTCKMCAFRLG